MQPCLTQNQWKQLKVCPSGCPSVPYIDKPSVFAHLQSKLLSFFTHPPTITGQLCGGRRDQNLYDTLDFSRIMANVSSRRSGGSCSWRGNKAGYCLLLLLACLLACWSNFAEKYKHCCSSTLLAKEGQRVVALLPIFFVAPRQLRKVHQQHTGPLPALLSHQPTKTSHSR